MEMLKRDVACPIGRVLFALADMRYTLCDVRNDGWSNMDGLVRWRHRQRTGGQSKKYLIGIGKGFIPMLQTSAHKSSSSK